MFVPSSRAGKIAVVLFALFLLAMNPPVLTVVGTRSLVLGYAPLYLWFVFWGVFVTLVLVWAAHVDAFGLTDDQIPPDLERTTPTPVGSDGEEG